mmetsp:Transcript_8669/g.12809  ORF Transcript_8669/g.12809 Transcript_8669/m.12809 type:complete len:171 (+) Transcript_8669:47-559(+)
MKKELTADVMSNQKSQLVERFNFPNEPFYYFKIERPQKSLFILNHSGIGFVFTQHDDISKDCILLLFKYFIEQNIYCMGIRINHNGVLYKDVEGFNWCTNFEEGYKFMTGLSVTELRSIKNKFTYTLTDDYFKDVLKLLNDKIEMGLMKRKNKHVAFPDGGRIWFLFDFS